MSVFGNTAAIDVLAKDGHGDYINIEVQRSDEGAVPKRARYNCSLIDANVSEPGEKFSELPETYVIFITENDILGENRPLYTIDRTIAESGKLFNDGMHIIYVNSQIRDDTALGRLMHDFLCKNPKEMHYEVLSGNAKLTKEREDEKGMCKIIDDIVQRERKEADIETEKKTCIATARQLIAYGETDIEKISKCCSLSVDEVKALMAEHST